MKHTGSFRMILAATALLAWMIGLSTAFASVPFPM